jgi:hypothetical protein
LANSAIGIEFEVFVTLAIKKRQETSKNVRNYPAICENQNPENPQDIGDRLALIVFISGRELHRF